ncbi:hypothetical protein WJX84_009409, partial [Apatococcus fuscideae]
MPGLPALSWSSYALAGFAVIIAWKLQQFVRADADLWLLSRRRPPLQAFAGQVVWIIGASQGLGEELAKWFAAHNAHLILSSRRLDQLQRVETLCRNGRVDGQQQTACLPFDLMAPTKDIEAAVERAHDIASSWNPALPGISHLVLNAGAGQAGAVEDTPHQVPEQLLGLNSVAPIRLTQALLPFWLPHQDSLQDQSGGTSRSQHQGPTAEPSASPSKSLPPRSRQQHKRRITVVSSMAAKVPSPGQALYAASKATLHGYYHSLASELANRGVGVTLCCPGPIAATHEGQMRAVWGAQGLTSKPAQLGSGSRLYPSRVASLIGTATYHGLQEVWISKHPILLLGYIFQLLPALGQWIMTIVGPKRVAQYKGGGGGYDLGSMLKRT